MPQATDTRTRVLILAPTGRDSDAAADQLGAAGLAVVVCKDMLQLMQALKEGAGVAVVAEEAFRMGLNALTDWVSKQPAWSDFPFVVLTSQRIYAREDARRIQVLESLGNVSLMERPLSAVSLISAVKSGLRARKRQYETQGMLEDLSAGEERLRLFIEHAPAAMVMLDRQMRYLAVSRRWMKTFDLRDSIIGRSHYDVFPEIPTSWREGHERCLEGASEISAADRLVRADGSSFWLKRDARPWRDNHGRIGGLIIAWEDITASRQAEERQQMLMREVLHRTKNLLAVIQSIAAGTFRRSGDPAQEAFLARLHALANAHGLLTDGAGEGAPLEEIARGQLAGFSGTVTIEGPHIFLKPSAAQSFALVIHELATNSAKYGALSSPAGRVSIRWSIRANGETPQLHFAWQERGGPPVAKPSHKGFGTVLLEHAVAGIDSAPRIDFAPGGLTYQTDTPLTMLTVTKSCQSNGLEATS
jgi:PAS domain S-box-containing protein